MAAPASRASTWPRTSSPRGWQVYGLARKLREMTGVTPVAADLRDAAGIRAALDDVNPAHVFLCTWLRQPTEAENVRVNGDMTRHLFTALAGKPLRHAALVTGTKHYLGPFESYGQTNNLATLTLAATGTLGNSQPITVGNNATLALAGNATNTRVSNQNDLVLNGGRIAFTGSTTSETFDNVAASGLSVVTLAAGATNSTLAFGALTRTDNATLNVRGPLAGSTGSTSKLTFAGGFPAISDPLAPGGANTGQYLPVVPFAAGTNSATAVNVDALINYDTTAGARFLGPANAANFQQVATGGTFDANTLYKNVNLAGSTATVTDAERVNSLAASVNSIVTGGGTLTVYSGAVLDATGNAAGGVTFNGPTLEFGANTGYLHLGGGSHFTQRTHLSPLG